MYSKIMVPVDLTHVQHLEKALGTAVALSRLFHAPVCYVGVAASAPGALGHNPAEFTARLEAFARSQAETHEIETSSAAYISHDPTIDLDDTLLKAVTESGSDLVIMASHIPGVAEYLFSSNAGYLAMHSKASVFVVR